MYIRNDSYVFCFPFNNGSSDIQRSPRHTWPQSLFTSSGERGWSVPRKAAHSPNVFPSAGPGASPEGGREEQRAVGRPRPLVAPSHADCFPLTRTSFAYHTKEADGGFWTCPGWSPGSGDAHAKPSRASPPSALLIVLNWQLAVMSDWPHDLFRGAWMSCEFYS